MESHNADELMQNIDDLICARIRLYSFQSQGLPYAAELALVEQRQDELKACIVRTVESNRND